MQSLRDKNNKSKSRARVIAFGAVFVVVVLGSSFFVSKMGGGFRTIFKPLWQMEENMGTNMHTFFANFASKRALEIENESLKQKLLEATAHVADRDTLAAENESLKSVLGRKTSTNLVLASVLVKPNRSVYDTLVIDLGSKSGIVPGNVVYAEATIPIGTVTAVGVQTSIVTLFTTAEQKTVGRLDGLHIDVDLIGRGGGNFQIQVPRDVTLAPNTNVLLPGITPQVIAVVTKSITDPRDPMQTFLLTSPININELNWVQVGK
jgi:cell shape-determining protein MreC